jgi:hypothetical protein
MFLCCLSWVRGTCLDIIDCPTPHSPKISIPCVCFHVLIFVRFPSIVFSACCSLGWIVMEVCNGGRIDCFLSCSFSFFSSDHLSSWMRPYYIERFSFTKWEFLCHQHMPTLQMQVLWFIKNPYWSSSQNEYILWTVTFCFVFMISTALCKPSHYVCSNSCFPLRFSRLAGHFNQWCFSS